MTPFICRIRRLGTVHAPCETDHLMARMDEFLNNGRVDKDSEGCIP
jgi:hypothetical protein